jgi:hypothetical protein
MWRAEEQMHELFATQILSAHWPAGQTIGADAKKF